MMPASGAAKILIWMGICAAWFGSPLSPGCFSMLWHLISFVALIYLWVVQFCQLTAKFLLSWWNLSMVLNVLCFVVPWVAMEMSLRLQIQWSILYCGTKKSRKWWHCWQEAWCESPLSEISIGQPGSLGAAYLCLSAHQGTLLGLPLFRSQSLHKCGF